MIYDDYVQYKKVKLYPCFKFYAMKTWESGGKAPLILNIGTSGGEWLASRPDLFQPRGRAPDTHLIWDWVGPRACLDAAAKRKIPVPARNRILVAQLVAQSL